MDNPFEADADADERDAWERAEAESPFGIDESEVEHGDPVPDEQLTELGYAHRLVHVHGDQLRYVAAWHRWLVWDGRRWRADDTGEAERWMKLIARRVTMAVVAEPNESDKDQRKRRERMKLALRAENAAAIHGALSLASTDELIATTPDELDADPHLLNVANGTIELRTGKLRPHEQSDLITKLAPASYLPGAESPEWAAFLERVQPDDQMRAYLARLMGHMLQGLVVEHVLPIMCGDGANGKSTFIGAIQHALGDYADAADPTLLAARTFDAHPTGVADLCGRRVAVLHEHDASRQLGEGTVKRLTGGDRLKARRMREDFWSFTPSHTFVLLTNHKPLVSGTDEGIWRRLRLVPWDVVIPVDERDDQLPDRLSAERDAVLVWLVDGYREWLAGGLRDPESVTAATNAYRIASDALGRFIDERCRQGALYSIPSSKLFSAWRAWCDVESEQPGSTITFADAMKRRGFRGTKRHGLMTWQGIALRDSVSADGDDDV